MRSVPLLIGLITLFSFKAAAASFTTKDIDDAAVLAWASGSAAQALTFTADDYPATFAKAKRHFTAEGWQSFQHSLDETHLFQQNTVYYDTVYTEQLPMRPPKASIVSTKD